MRNVSATREASPAVMETCPGARAVIIGGSSVERLATVRSLEVQVSPVTTAPLEFNAWSVRVSPTSKLRTLGTMVTLLPPWGLVGTVNGIALLQIPPC